MFSLSRWVSGAIEADVDWMALSELPLCERGWSTRLLQLPSHSICISKTICSYTTTVSRLGATFIQIFTLLRSAFHSVLALYGALEKQRIHPNEPTREQASRSSSNSRFQKYNMVPKLWLCCFIVTLSKASLIGTLAIPFDSEQRMKITTSRHFARGLESILGKTMIEISGSDTRISSSLSHAGSLRPSTNSLNTFSVDGSKSLLGSKPVLVTKDLARKPISISNWDFLRVGSEASPPFAKKAVNALRYFAYLFKKVFGRLVRSRGRSVSL